MTLDRILSLDEAFKRFIVVFADSDTFNAVLYSSDDPKCNDPRFSANFEKGHIYINCSKFCFV